MSYLRDNIDKVAKKALDISKGITDATSEVVPALGGNVLKPLTFEEKSVDDRKKMSGTNPIMDKHTAQSWNEIIGWVSRDNKSPYGGKQDNYDCVYMYGPPGTGKTVFAKALFGAVPDKYNLKLANITAGDLMERGAEKLNRLKQDAFAQIEQATSSNPICLGLFLDEVEASLNKDRGLNPGVVNEYLTLINEIKDKAAENKNVYILGALATNFDE